MPVSSSPFEELLSITALKVSVPFKRRTLDPRDHHYDWIQGLMFFVDWETMGCHSFNAKAVSVRDVEYLRRYGYTHVRIEYQDEQYVDVSLTA